MSQRGERDWRSRASWQSMSLKARPWDNVTDKVNHRYLCSAFAFLGSDSLKCLTNYYHINIIKTITTSAIMYSAIEDMMHLTGTLPVISDWKCASQVHLWRLGLLIQPAFIPSDIKSRLANNQEALSQNTALPITSLRLDKVIVEQPLLDNHPSKQASKQAAPFNPARNRPVICQHRFRTRLASWQVSKGVTSSACRLTTCNKGVIVSLLMLTTPGGSYNITWNGLLNSGSANGLLSKSDILGSEWSVTAPVEEKKYIYVYENKLTEHSGLPTSKTPPALR